MPAKDLTGSDIHVRSHARSAHLDVRPAVVGEVHVYGERADVVEPW